MEIPSPTSSPTKPRSRFPTILRAGGRSASAFTLAKATLGAGALAMPSSFQGAGIVLSVLLLIALGWMSAISINMIGRAQTHSGRDTFEEIVRLYYNAWVGYVFEITMILFCFGTAVAYLISIADLLNPVFEKWIGSQHEHDWYGVLLLNRTVFSALVTYIFLLPLSLFERINNVRWISFAGVMSVIFLAICIVYLLIKHGVFSSPQDTTSTYLWPSKGFNGVISAASAYIFAYVCQVNVPHIYSEMVPFSERNLRQVSYASVALCFVVYVAVGTCGFLTYGSTTRGSIIQSMRADFLEGNIFVTIAFILMGVAVLAAYPLNIYPLRAAVVGTVKGITGRRHLHRWVGPAITFISVSLTLVVAIYLPDVKVVLDLVGSMTGSIICYIIPAGFCVRIVYFKRNKMVGKLKDELAAEDDTSMDYPNWLSFGFIAFGAVFVVIGTYVSLVGVVEFYQK
ncbi:10 transmembrane domain, possible aa transporter, putative [Perkinsus marinus ATCC 50983]|uniref:10 transmembrane domain, possible aa transporter, putative n=1 Tax=Perkinsus marinus (strain ATCC 50983 / TXsc) TaxID=423536 RepID=C5LLE6_PERM5|nr:10 transmembrane domain, possible aa transporter, putative [Perkinsus marinus ATCC 50983]EER02445.1 10 transmembrane domain, possible aa transporter, putative [Perkinsus marinus ATCC 50983]|eukprot:XP_002769727.1 10 transmembrane domain, possible aa transporter, putative [Perkinsus marinus ATCC 50983]